METLDTSAMPPTTPVSYRPVAIRYGAIWGGASILMILVGYLTNMDPAMPTTGTAVKVLFGLISFAVSIMAVVLAIKHHRDRDLGGYISLGRAVLVGLMTGLVAGLIGAVFMVLYTEVINPTYAESIREMMNAQYEEQGMSDEQIEMASGMTGFMFNPIWTFFSQLLGGAFFGTLIGLIAGAIMKREPLRQA